MAVARAAGTRCTSTFTDGDGWVPRRVDGLDTVGSLRILAGMTAIQHEWVSLQATDGTSFAAYVARPAAAGDARGGVIVLQEIWGVNKHIREVADRFARLNYVTLAPDVFHRTAPRFEAPYTERTGMDHAMKLTPDGVKADLAASYAYLRGELGGDGAKIASCGFCMGGRLSFVANALLPLSAAVSFYGGGIASQLDLAAAQHGPLLLFWGGKDTHITKEQRRATADALEAAGKRFTEVNVGHAQHGFFCDQRPSYDAEAAKEAWGLVTAFLDTNMG